jgi:putative phosphoesterase
VRVAALYDVHANLSALEAVLAEVEHEQVDLVVAGGDIVAGPMPAETIDRLRSLGDRVSFIHGNGDRGVAARDPGQGLWAERARWAREQLSGDQLEFISSWRDTAGLMVDGLGAVLFCHGTPRSDEEIVTRITPEERLSGILAGVLERVVVCGHTHVQYDRVVGDMRLVNAGSVGMPYEDEPGAYWALLGPDVELRRTAYDLDAAAQRVRQTGFPGAADFAENHILHPASAAEATEHFEQMAAERLL